MDWRLFLSIWVVLVIFSFAILKEAVGFPKSGLRKFFSILGVLAIGPVLFIVFSVCSAGRFTIQSMRKPL